MCGVFISYSTNNQKLVEQVIALITPEYLQSKFCMMELGAAWMEASYLCPILGAGVDYKDLDNTPLKSLQMRKMDDEDDWFAIYNEIVNRKIVEHFDCTQFNRKLRAFCSLT